MKIKLKLLLALIFLLSANITSFAQIEYNEADWGVHPMDYSRVGTAGWQFLKLPTNAKTAAMGGVISSISNGDANSAFTNPASIEDVKDYDVAVSRMNWVADIGYQTFSVVKNFGDLGTFGLSLLYLDYGTMERTENRSISDILGNSIGVVPVLDFDIFTAADLGIGISYSRKITDKLQVGGTARYLNERLDDASASTWSLDIGTMYYTGLNTLRISFVGKNFGPDAEFGTYIERIQQPPIKVKMPMQLVIGAAYDLMEEKDDSPHKLVTVIEYNKPNDGNDKINLGAEYTFMKALSLRGGYRFNYDEQGMTLGAGLNYVYNGMNVKIDYAFISVGIFKSVHMFSVGMSF